ncbi:UNVERIFIED_CONTAM: putative ribonuclease H protein [Sesamum radiatum]|uniref:Ribonuclease H protein n=1 Tax=Sesamum radiatum TaxID=300843 RepID=A0AAW2W4F2_SESRA
MFGVAVASRNKSGGLALLWDKSADVVVQSFSFHHIDVSVKSKDDGEWWRFLGIYGEPDIGKRDLTWQLLRRLHSQSVRAWLCAGDFNEILYQSEKEGGSSRPQWQLRNFRMALSDYDLSDIGFRGDPFTWSNRHPFPNTIQERLDRACANLGWSRLFPSASVMHIPMNCSDHKAILIRFHDNPNCTIKRARQHEAASIRKELEELAAFEETTWRQRSKALWLKEGDRNTGFFHRKANHRFQTNLISKIRNTTGDWLTETEDIQRHIVAYFRSVFASNRPRNEDIARGTEPLRRVVDEGMREDLIQPYTEAEVTRALHQMADFKSPGPDGMSPIFYQKFWHIVKQDVVPCVLSLLSSCHMHPHFNDTHIVLIPKCKNPEYLSQFRPISLCNVVYKLASKTLANRLKLILDRIISPTQSAFVPGRLITDKFLLAFELNHFLNTKSKGRQGYMALKLDVSKAYDKVEWTFLEQLSFTEGGSRWDYSGDSYLSPGPSISHLLFADDTLIFCRDCLDDSRAIRAVLDTYRRASGQEINLLKSSIGFSHNTSVDMRSQLAADLNIRIDNCLAIYLGLPSKASRSKKDLFATIRDRIWSKITGWSEKLLSQAGKEVLIKSVIQAIPTYAMGCFSLPITLLSEIQGLIARFWWNNRGSNKIHWVSYQRLCESKLIGGLGFRQLRNFNLAMLAKQLWRILRWPDRLLCQVLKARYFPNCDIFSAPLGHRPSFTWRSLLSAQPLFRAGCRWRVGSGANIRIWSDPWLPRPLTFRPITHPSTASLDLRVADLRDPSTGDWDVQRVRHIFWPPDSDLILSIPLSRTGGEDILTWHFSKNGMFSVRSAYHLACSIDNRPCSSGLKEAENGWWRKLWQTKVPNKIKIFIWKVCLNALPTSANLTRRIPGFSGVCPLCQEDGEDVVYTLISCPFARQSWGLANFHSSSIPRGESDVFAWFRLVASTLSNPDFSFFLGLCWAIWWCRNRKMFHGTCLTPDQTVCFAEQYIDSFLLQNADCPRAVVSDPCPRWHLPQVGIVKLNFDGALMDQGCMTGLGIIARDHNGSCLDWISTSISRRSHAELAESLAAREAIFLAYRRGWPSVVLEGDCASLIHKLGSNSCDFSDVGLVISDILVMTSLFTSCQFLFARRVCNSVAHLFAKSGFGCSEDGTVLPCAVASLLAVDSSS